MSRGVKAILAVLILILAGSAAFLLLRPKNGGHVARISLDGQVVEEIDLSRVEAPYTLTIDGPGGFSNTITVEKGRICVSKAGCPDQICVHQGYISDGTTPIVCLPNKLIIEIIGGGSGLDAATG